MRPPPDYCPICSEIDTACNCYPLRAIPRHDDDASAPEVEHPRIEIIATGEKQCVIAETPARTIPSGPLKPKRPQTEKPTLLELYEGIISQPKLF